MKKTIEILGYISIIIAVITGLYTIKEIFKNNNPSLNIKIDNIEHATRLSQINGLQAFYYFNKVKVNNLWIINTTITNDGNITIIGIGENKNIITDNIKVKLDRKYKLIEAKILENNFSATDSLPSQESIDLKFTQWRPEEYIKLKLFIEGDTASIEPPKLVIDDRQIINGSISYYNTRYEIEGTKYVKDVLPFGLSGSLKVAAISVSATFLAIIPFMLYHIIIQIHRLNIWYNNNYEAYKNSVEELIKNKKMPHFVIPRELPEWLWAELAVPKPEGFPPKDAHSIISISIVLIMACIGILAWITPVFW